MYMAIQTKFLSPTNYRGARIKAVSDAGSLTLSWDYGLCVPENHHAAAVALAERKGWPTDLIGEALPGSGYAFVRRPA